MPAGGGCYLQRLRAKPVDQLLLRESAGRYPHGLAAAVLLALDAVRAGDGTGVCGAVMDLVSVLSAAGVPRAVLHAARSRPRWPPATLSASGTLAPGISFSGSAACRQEPGGRRTTLRMNTDQPNNGKVRIDPECPAGFRAIVLALGTGTGWVIARGLHVAGTCQPYLIPPAVSPGGRSGGRDGR
jgi:hypothetical protein